MGKELKKRTKKKGKGLFKALASPVTFLYDTAKNLSKGFISVP